MQTLRQNEREGGQEVVPVLILTYFRFIEMKIPLVIFTFICSFSLLQSCRNKPDLELTGKWQSLNGLAGIEFFPDHTIDLFKDNQPVWSMASTNGHLNYSINPLQDNWFQFMVLDGKSEFTRGKIEVVRPDRIRIYFFKHHDILDVADEYQKANDFQSYSPIMESILKEPDPHLIQ